MEENKKRKTNKGTFTFYGILKDDLDKGYLVPNHLRHLVEQREEFSPMDAYKLALGENDYKLLNNFFCPDCEEKLILDAKHSDMVSIHFRHLNYDNEKGGNHYPRMSEWHKESQNQFKDYGKIDAHFPISEDDRLKYMFFKQHKCFYADVFVNAQNGKRIAIEYQKSYISTDAFTLRTEFYAEHFDLFIWVFDGFVRNIISPYILIALKQHLNVLMILDNNDKRSRLDKNIKLDEFNPDENLYCVHILDNFTPEQDIEEVLDSIQENLICISKKEFKQKVIDGTIQERLSMAVPDDFYSTNKTIKELYEIIKSFEYRYGKINCFGANRTGKYVLSKVMFREYDLRKGDYRIGKWKDKFEDIYDTDKSLWNIDWIKTENCFIGKQTNGKFIIKPSYK